MPSVYSHFSAQDTKDAIFQADGIIKKAEEERSFFEPIKCSNCKSLQNPKNIFCSVCNSPLNEESMKQLEAENRIKKAILSNPKIMEMLEASLKTQ